MATKLNVSATLHAGLKRPTLLPLTHTKNTQVYTVPSIAAVTWKLFYLNHRICTETTYTHICMLIHILIIHWNHSPVMHSSIFSTNKGINIPALNAQWPAGWKHFDCCYFTFFKWPIYWNLKSNKDKKSVTASYFSCLLFWPLKCEWRGMQPEVLMFIYAVFSCCTHCNSLWIGQSAKYMQYKWSALRRVYWNSIPIPMKTKCHWSFLILLYSINVSVRLKISEFFVFFLNYTNS